MKSFTESAVIRSMVGASLLLAGSLAIADTGKAPIQLTDAQMDRIVAGSSVTTYYQGYSTNVVEGDGPGVSSITVTTTGGCPANALQGCEKRNENAIKPLVTTITTTGPGKSPSDRIFANQGRI